MPETSPAARGFLAQWFAAYKASLLIAACQLALAIGLGVGVWYAWAVTASPAAVFWWMTLVLAAVVGIGIWNASTVTEALESRARAAMIDLEAERAKRPRPSLMLTFESPSYRHFVVDQIAPLPLGIHNAAPIPMLDIEFSLVHLTGSKTMRIRPIDVIGPLAHTHARINVDRRRDNGVMTTDADVPFSHVMFEAIRPWIHSNGDAQCTWPITASFRDIDGNRFTARFDIGLDEETMECRVKPRWDSS